MKTMSDPAFLDEMKKRKLEPDPSSGDELEAVAREVMSHPREIVERMKKILGE
jgi:tripartite-type tricarboxylate transporter receptor subunit TctC